MFDLNGDRLSIGQRLRLDEPIVEIDDSVHPQYASAYRELTTLQQQLIPSNRVIHRVRSGESLWVIARRYGISVLDLQRMNGLGPNSIIRPGQRLTIERGRRIAGNERQRNYIVRSGDSLWTIARRQGVSMENLMRWNQLNANSILRIGQRLVLRGG